MIRFVLFWTWLAWLGVGLMPTSASIIWSGTIDYWLSSEAMGDTHWVSFDFNSDDILDFNFRGHASTISFNPEDRNSGISALGAYVPVDINTSIGSSITEPYEWLDGEQPLLGDNGDGGFYGATTALLGVSFDVFGSTHYGWFKLSHTPVPWNPLGYQSSSTLIIHDFAWETEPDTPIIAGAVPEPSSAILTVIGALSAWVLRRQNRISRHWKES